MAEYLDLEKVLDDKNIITVQTREYGSIEVIPVDTITDIELADVQPVKRGKWKSSQRTIETGTVYCSNCAIEYYISDLQTVGDCNGIVHYCPNCGARMDGDSE